MPTKKMYSSIVYSAIIATLVLVTGAVPAFAAKETLVLAVGGENEEGYDPLLGWGTYGNPLFQSTLLKRDANLNIIPDLATNWTLSKDRTVWTVTIRSDALFSDGSSLTAKDVAFTFNKGLKAGGKIDLTPLEKAEAPNATTVKLTLKKPDITFIQHLITQGIVPENLYGPNYGRHPIGSGPYKLIRWDEGQQMVVEANELYYGAQPQIKRLVFLFSDEDAALAAARAGEVDVLGVPSNLARQDIPGMKLHVVKSVDNRGLMFPTVPSEGKTTPHGVPIGNTVTADIALRKAINYAIDRKALVAGVLDGYGRPAFGVVDDLPWDNPAIRFKDNALQKAKTILKEAGWVDTDGDGVREKNGLKAEFSIVYNAKDSLRQGLALAVSDMLKPVGINAIPRGENWDRIKTQLTHTNVVVYGFGDHSPLEMYKLYHTPGSEPLYWNAGFYSNPVVDEYLDKAKAAKSIEASLPFWKKAQWDGKTGFTTSGDAAWAWMVNLDHTYFLNNCLDVGTSQMEPHGHGWPITANIQEWKWICK
ncbi:ABC transporter substrate-binding protein [Pseudodesulfovibrio piezophilus]|uniref:Dipeptide ABC transporter, solute-binding protein n=1 Tax=Pseudodesulfovibrio piezophilus (strain DSM 21447 / JCM 15486 / C1TLV30) TaxID=1322246 RepID=M1WJS0_PSEP2|nr:ABC transporter substrate-binding protein [Pseudodesulfovibrio piezophilus]CCH48381.1 Dipeptide ABC transporter, solute-binding protein [Pseudodesulfovibrio piezophilus C1TLV30]